MPTIRKIIDYPYKIRDAINEKLAEAITNKFPISGKKYVAEVSNVHTNEDNSGAVYGASASEQKKVLLTKGNKTIGIYGDLTIKDIVSGKVVASLKKHRLMSVPYYTQRFTMMVDGNEYAVVSQMRTKSGVYTRKRGNDELESAFNLEKGANFKLIMDPDTGIFKVDILNCTFPVWALLQILGAKPEDGVRAVGEELYKKNYAAVTDAQLNRARNMLYKKLVKYKDDVDTSHTSATEMDEGIRAYFNGTKMDPETTEVTLGTAYHSVSAATILRAMGKIIELYKGETDVDERDNLEFQKIYGVEDLLAEVVTKSKDITSKITKFLDNFNPAAPDAKDKLKTGFSAVVFSKPVRNFLTTSTLSRLPSQINPIEFMDTASIITRLGEGAISSERAVPFSTRAATYSSAGLIDPIAGPESFKIGIDVHATVSAAKGSDHEFYKRVTNPRTGEKKYMRSIELYNKKVGFPDPHYLKNKKRDDVVYATYKGKLVKCHRAELDYQIEDPSDLCTYTTNNVPFMACNQGNRLLMSDKHMQQALPLTDPDKRLVKSMTSGMDRGSVTGLIGKYSLPLSPVDGTVSKIDADAVFIKDKSGKVHRVDYETDLPLATKTFLSDKITVKVGDHVTEGQALGTNNFTKDNELACGKNLLVAYMPYKGLNHEDAIIVSEAAAKKMTSIHASKIFVDISRNMIRGKQNYLAAFPTNFTQEQLENIDADGVIKKGSHLHEGDPVVLIMEACLDNRINQVLGKLNKALMHPYKDLSETYDDHYEAEVTDVSKTDKLITVVLKLTKPLQVGDKLAGSYGNKGVCSVIVPTDKMPRDENGEPLDLVLTSAGVISRINPAQILETALGKIAKRTGGNKVYNIENYSMPDAVAFVKNELKKHNMHDKETLFDPETGKKIPNVFVGVQHMAKLFKTTDTNFAARGIDGPYDQDDVPSGSGDTGPKGMGGMEINALLGSNTRALLREGTMLRSSKNADFWRAYQNGMVPNFPREKKTFNRFIATLKQAGINVTRQGDNLVAAPLTDKDVAALSSGEVKNGLQLAAKNLAPESGGLFDTTIFGGMKGDRWGHINLAEPVVNPVFKSSAQKLLGLSTKEFDEAYYKNGGGYIKDKLNAIDIPKALKETEDALRDGKVKRLDIDNTVKKLKALRALAKNGSKAGDAYVLTKFPVLPPVYRPIVLSPNGDIMKADANDMYKDLILQNETHKELIKSGLCDEDARKALVERLGEVTGMLTPSGLNAKGRTAKGAIQFIAGDVPKTGYFYKKCIYGRMNMTGRATISPDTSLGLDEIGLPRDIAWGMYKPFIIRGLSKMGYSPLDAEEAVEARNEAATRVLEMELEKRPVIMNRAPSLWRHSMVAAKPLLRDGKNVRINSIWEKGLNADYDGDAVNLHVPVTDEAIEDAKSIFPSKQLFNDKKVGDLIQAPTAEPIIGLYKATANIGKPRPANAKVYRFNNVEEAWKAYYAGNVKLTDYVDILC